MTNRPKLFNNTETIIDEPLKFKAKLAIGEEAYTALRIKNKAGEAFDTLGAVSFGAGVAQSSIIASTFFSAPGLLGVIGLGTAATPIGWVVAAAVISGGAWAGVSRYVKKYTDDQTTVIPHFINTPLDVLALALIDLMAPLALKVAAADGVIDASEKAFIRRYFIKEWGYSENFMTDALTLAEQNLSKFKVEELAVSLAEFKKENPDCNYEKMTDEIISFLNGVMESDGEIDEKEELAIQKISIIFKETGENRFIKPVKETISKGSDYIKRIIPNKMSNKTESN